MTGTGVIAIVLNTEQIARIEHEAETAYPLECCGLIAGRDVEGGIVTATRIVPSANMRSDSPRDRFEVDPQVRFDLMLALRETDERIIGFYHSHPDHPASPSAHDLKMAFEPDLVWIITAVKKGRATATTAHRPSDDASRFITLDIRIAP
ncbi:MAG: M67 family metallopeptidase [Rhodospirillales bacterium]|nr:M67 family metallopeptidase [Rhodospirillales bacterium]MCW9003059.1 M67 family metallopeptidase [Rhodospirillales bacterium]